MRSLILRPLFTLMLAISALALLKLCVDGFTRREFEQAHQFPVVLFGDSHGNDVPVKQVPRFNRPAQDLVSTWMRMRELADLKGPDSKVEVVVLTIWPMKFGPVAERRMSGRVQEDGWQQSVWARRAPCCVGETSSDRNGRGGSGGNCCSMGRNWSGCDR